MANYNNPLNAIETIFSLNNEYSFESQMNSIKSYKKIADRLYRVSVIKFNLYEDLRKLKLLSPSVNNAIANNLNVGALIHADDCINNSDWSHTADASITEIKLLQNLGIKYEKLINKIK